MTTASPIETGTAARAVSRPLLAWACALALLPGVLGIVFVALEVYPAYRSRFFWFVGPWAGFGLATILMAMALGFAPVRALVSRSHLANIALMVLLALLALALLRYDPVDFWKPLRSILLIQAFLVGCAAFFLVRREGETFLWLTAAALIAAPFLHLPALVWIVALEAGNPDMKWHWSVPGFPWVRTWNYSVELAIALGLGLFAAPGRPAPARLLLGGAALSLLWALLFWGGGRGATMGLFGGMVAVTVICRVRVLRLWLSALATAGIGAFLSTLVWVPPGGAFGLLPGVERTMDGEPTGGRLELWQQAAGWILEKPLLGHGFAEFMRWLHLHNFPLDVLHSFGLVGALAVVVLIVHLFAPLVRARRDLDSPLAQALLLGLCALLVHGLVAGTYFHVHSQIWQALLLGGLLALCPPRGDPVSPAPPGTPRPFR